MPPPNPYALPGSVFVITTGQPGQGKSEQILRLLQARAPDGSPAVLPVVVLLAESSGEGTMGDLFISPDVLVWPVRTCDEASAVLRVLFPEGRTPLTLAEAKAAHHKAMSDAAKKGGLPPPEKHPASAMDQWPIRGVGVDSISTLLRGQKAAVRDASRPRESTAAGDKYKISTSGRDLENDQKRIAALATGPAQNLVDALSGLTMRHRGLLVAVACHTRAHIEVCGSGADRTETACGEAPDFGAPKAVKAGANATGFADLWQTLAAKANIIWHCYATAPDLRGVPAEQINDPENRERWGVVTRKGVYPGVESVKWVKCQGGGWLGWFGALPALWHPDVPWSGAEDFAARVASLPSGERYDGGPDLGLMLELCLAEHAASKAGAA